MDKNIKEHNLSVFCDQILRQREKFGEEIINQLMTNDIDSPIESWAWNYYQTFGIIIEYLKDTKLWQPTYFRERIINNVQNY